MKRIIPKARRFIAVAVHIGLVLAANTLAFWVRFDGAVPPAYANLWFATLPWLVAIRAAFFVPFRLYQGPWRYTGVSELTNVVLGVLSSSVVFALFETFRRVPYPRSIVLIEDKANGPAVIQMLRAEIPGILPINPEGGKESRLRAVSPLFEAGNVYLPDPSIAPWVEDVIAELTVFPNGAHDDDVDAASQALNWLRARAGGVIAFYRKQNAETARMREEAKSRVDKARTTIGMG